MTYETVESQPAGCSPPPVAEDGAKVQQKIAIIGMACRLPGDATSPSKLWDLCETGRDGWSPIPHDRFDADAYHDANKDKAGRVSGKAYFIASVDTVTGGYFLKQDVAAFDAAFFSMSGNLADGPSMSIDTGCSAGLVALHQGSRCILSGDSGISVVVASNLMLNPDFFDAGSNLNMLGTNGRCYAWDSRAEGCGRGEGIVGLILKPLDAAPRDGDHVTCVNQDGKTSTIASPSANAQVKLIEDCYRRANLDPAETSYVEAHMTGTQTGDTTEAEALARTLTGPAK
ncbi:putative Polyketide synthase [Seiridium unicorne]|uniref:Polyketide synthase n=1 Tax=Seiridium unicorne TaxID=138068 RepID=A0ABR2ULG7_9PEZI